MSHQRRSWAGCVVAILAFGACGGQTSPQLGGETHWLSACTEDTDCGGGYQCLCRMCTLACDSTATCSGIGEAAECLDAQQSSVAEDCAGSGVSSICLRRDETTALDAATGSGACGTREVRLEGTCVSCDERSRLETEAMQELVSRSEWLTCTEAADCTLVDTSSACEQRGNTVLAAASEPEFDAAKTALEQQFCLGPDATTLCVGSTVDGPWPDASACDQGTCVPRYQVEAQRIDVELRCRSSVYEVAGHAACIPGDGAVTLALDPEGQCWVFPTTCIPEGFVVASNGEACPQVVEPCDNRCVDRAQDACESDGACRQQSANPEAADSTCYLAQTEPAGCIAADAVCTEEEVVAVAPDGTCWRFTSGCFPSTYRTPEEGECPPLMLCE